MKKIILSAGFALLYLASYCQTAPPQAAQTKTRCTAITTKGTQCLNMGKPDKCHLHNPAAVHCSGITQKGQPCKSPVKKGETACYRHKA